MVIKEQRRSHMLVTTSLIRTMCSFVSWLCAEGSLHRRRARLSGPRWAEMGPSVTGGGGVLKGKRAPRTETAQTGCCDTANKARNPVALDLTLATALLTGNWRLSEPTMSQINRNCVDLGCSAPAATQTSRKHTVTIAVPRIQPQSRQIVVQGIFQPTKDPGPNLLGPMAEFPCIQ